MPRYVAGDDQRHRRDATRDSIRESHDCHEALSLTTAMTLPLTTFDIRPVAS